MKHNEFKMDKTFLSVASLSDKSDEMAYWLSLSPQERLQILEFIRQIVYGYDPISTRLQRILEVTKLGES